MLAENKDNTRDIILRISPTRNTLMVEERKLGGAVAYKEISPWICTSSSTTAIPAGIFSTAVFFRKTASMFL